MSTFVVTNTYDNGNNANPVAGSLRWAVVAANKQGGSNTIDFKIGKGVQTISLVDPLPQLNSTVTIDGTTQPGYSGAPLIVLNGANAGYSSVGLDLAGSHNVVKGLVIEQFNVGIELEPGTYGSLIAGNYIGTDWSGSHSLGNNYGIVDYSMNGNTIGGTTASCRNVISGNLYDGIEILPENFFVPLQSSGKVGTLPVPTTQIVISHGYTPDCVEGNYIGTTASGNYALGNGTGLYVYDAGVVVGGTSSGARNVISGNSGVGIEVYACNSTGVVIEGNYIGTTASGNYALGNLVGIELDYDSYVTIGGTSSGARNVISGNSSCGIEVNYCSYVTIEGNYIGTNASGNGALGNGYGIELYYDSYVTIGGTWYGSGNVISGNYYDGIYVYDCSYVYIQGNLIGTTASGSYGLGNYGSGVNLDQYDTYCTVGGSAYGAGNVIAYNGGDGVRVGSGSYDDLISRNSIFNNRGKGIDLYGTGNNDQYAPTLSTVTRYTSSGQTVVTGSLYGAPNTKFTLEFFTNPKADPSGYGQGQSFVGSVYVTTNSQGYVNFKVTLTAKISANQYLSATATDPYGNTSQFSNDLRVY
jgi:parallel beta-helix repeat protein